MCDNTLKTKAVLLLPGKISLMTQRYPSLFLCFFLSHSRFVASIKVLLLNLTTPFCSSVHGIKIALQYHEIHTSLRYIHLHYQIMLYLLTYFLYVLDY